jgi:hypothetical protein
MLCSFEHENLDALEGTVEGRSLASLGYGEAAYMNNLEHV